MGQGAADELVIAWMGCQPSIGNQQLVMVIGNVGLSQNGVSSKLVVSLLMMVIVG